VTPRALPNGAGARRNAFLSLNVVQNFGLAIFTTFFARIQQDPHPGPKTSKVCSSELTDGQTARFGWETQGGSP